MIFPNRNPKKQYATLQNPSGKCHIFSLPGRVRSGFLIATLAFCFSINVAAKEIVVDPATAVKTLTQALADAQNGDVIIVKSGTYRESPVVVNKSVTIIGDGEAIFDGEEEHQVFTITADNVTLKNLDIRNCGVSFIDDKAGVKVKECANVRIENCRFLNTFFGIYLAKSRDCTIIGNNIRGFAKTEAASGNGVHLWYCRDIEVADNRITGHRDGIYFEFVQGGKIHGNHSEKNLRYGLHFMFSDDCRYEGNTFRNNGAGVAVMYTKNVTMTNNHFEQNWGSASFGLLLKDITDSDISNNHFIKNSIGIYAENSSRIDMRQNNFRENGWAIKIMSNCADNIISENNFIANAFDVATNSRNNFSKFSENFWGNYSGYDLNRDGFGDVPYRPVRLFSLIVEQNPPALIMLRSLFVDLLDVAENVFPVLTPETLVDERPLMHPLKISQRENRSK